MAMPRRYLAALAAGGLAACATPTPDPRAWQVLPVFRIQHSQAQFDGHYAVGRYLEGQRRWHQAEQAYRRALALRPTHVEAHNRLALVLAEQGQLLPAIEALRQALALEPQAADLLNNLGYLQLRAGQREAAATTLRQAVSLDPHNALARANLRAALSSDAGPTSIGNEADPRSSREPAPTPRAEHGTAAPLVAVTTSQAQAPRPLPLSSTGAPPLVIQQSPNVPPLPLQAGLPTAARSAAQATPSPTAVPAPATTRPPAQATRRPAARIELSNGNGAEGFAAKVRAWLAWLGVKVDRLTNQRPYRQGITVVQYRDGYEAQARELARSLPLPAELEVRDDLDPRADVRVLLGHDFRARAHCLGATPCAAPPMAATSGEPLPQ